MVESDSPSLPRNELLRELEYQLLGPPLEEEVSDDHRIPLSDSISDHLAMGVLYPRRESEADARDDDVLAQVHSDDAGQGPGAMGLTFLVRGDDAPVIGVQLEAGRLEKNPADEAYWTRVVLAGRDSPILEFEKPARGKLDEPVLEERAKLHLRWRRIEEELWQVTVALSNSQDSGNSHEDRSESALLRVRIRCRVVSGEFEDFGLRDSGIDDEASREWAVIYRDRKAFAEGHGVSVDWSGSAQPEEVWTEHLPRAVIPDMTYNFEDDCPEAEKALSMEGLSKGSRAEVRAWLDAFIGHHRAWIERARSRIDAISREIGDGIESVSGICEGLLERHEDVSRRLSRSVELLAGDLHDEDVFRSFQLANEAMHRQITQSWKIAGNPRKDPQWRPFQLAFQLLVLPDLVDPESDDSHRDEVDLLWFPTGGGKTEAYLGLAAFEIFRRRMQHGEEGAGVAVIKRYTLRALTFQQFERAGKMIAACELIRRERRGEIPGPPITVGLWAGQSISPNRTTRDATENHAGGAVQIFERCDTGKVPFDAAMRRCCWCEKELKKVRIDQCEDVGKKFKISCASSDCEFGSLPGLPVEFVDDSLYVSPPSLLIGVIDKFAHLPLVGETRSILGGKNRPPSLIIQDELHLIDGPLGSLAGAYEAAIDVICNRNGIPPKIIGATATISGASDQCKALYGRGQRTFPPPGLDADDSFFMRVDHTGQGRLYVGVMGAGVSPLHTAVLSAASLLRGARNLKDRFSSSNRWTAIDGYLSLIAYHNSLRELGDTMTASMDHIPRHLERMGMNDHLEVRELSSKTESRDVAGVLASLARRTRENGTPEIDLLACSSIFGVGVDIPRLGLMMVMGQPKTTADYIQSTSRVGRGGSPGLVVTMLSGTRSRDRSHYESFRSYHESIYRSVEPTSVTPYSLAARKRSLAPAFVAVCRHLTADLGDLNGAAELFHRDHAERLEQMKEAFLDRCKQADPSESTGTREQLSDFLERWQRLARGGNNKALRYFPANWVIQARQDDHVLVMRDCHRALEPVEIARNLEIAPSSLRHVDHEVFIRSLEGRHD